MIRHKAGRLTVLPALLSLAACGPAETAPGPDDVTESEARALDEAAAMLDEQRLPAEAAAQSPSPSAAPSAQTAARASPAP